MDSYGPAGENEDEDEPGMVWGLVDKGVADRWAGCNPFRVEVFVCDGLPRVARGALTLG